MIGDLIIYIKLKWKQFWCVHNYVAHRGSVEIGMPRICNKCGRYEKE